MEYATSPVLPGPLYRAAHNCCPVVPEYFTVAISSEVPDPEALALVQIKVEGAEKGAVSPEIDARHRAAWPALEADLQAALERSPLPESAANEAACEDWLVDLRCARL